ncbi:aldolase [Dactylosporangium roseum]|uniref:Aldolase n=1 Tax=Dactylosporangium roseum TaxID=47989 RepID=A0ABY5YXV2_9ACTN|nr:HpcH/HpaI aldolase/citrate lyase family protein [Dactylosporangium roseum]UWZ34569.1 aldolase [Dactylosporangium roseum]
MPATPDRSVLSSLITRVDELLQEADAQLSARYPGESTTRQPVHTVYVPADRCTPDLVQDWGREALLALDTHGRAVLLEALNLGPSRADGLIDRVERKLREQPIEDLRIDFEDGYQVSSDDGEDADAEAVVTILRHLSELPSAPAHLGIRFKSLEARTRRRGLRTLDLVVGGLARSGGLPPGFVLTLPKVTSVEQVRAMVTICEVLERSYDLASGALRFELQIETPQSILGADGRATVAPMIHAARGRCSGVHYGTYDYAAACGIAPAYQSMEHPLADHAKATMHVAAARTGVFVSDGSTNVLPIGGTAEVRAAWALHARLVRRSIERGIYQGWDLHPGQLPTRYGTVFAFMDEGLPTAVRRLTGYLAGAASGVMDEPATATALARFILRALECGATSEADLTAQGVPDREALVALARRRDDLGEGTPRIDG